MMTRGKLPGTKTASRRDFIKISAVATAIVGLGAVGIRKALAGGQIQQVHDTRLLMGTYATLTLVTDEIDSSAWAAIDTAFDCMQGLEPILSHYRPDSQLSQLNAAGVLIGASQPLIEVLERSLDLSNLTGGAFDVSVQPVLDLYRTAMVAGGLPAAHDLAAARRLVDFRQIRLDGPNVRLGLPSMALTLDGIGKGYVIDQGAQVLLSRGFTNVLVDVGGDMQGYGRAGSGAWRIAIQAPADPQNAIVGTTRIENAALATSGDYFNAFSADRRHNHIIDPRTGDSPQELSSVTTLAASACFADALSTSLMVLGTRAGLALVDRLPGVEALLIGKEGQAYRSSGFPLDTTA